MASAHVQHKGAIEASLDTAISVTFDATVASGNLVCGCVLWSNATDVLDTITDDKSNSYTIQRQILNSGGDPVSVATFFCLNITNAPQTITANFSTDVARKTIIVHEASGCLTTGALDVEIGDDDTSGSTAENAVTSTAVTTTAAGDYCAAFTAGTYDYGTAATYFSAGTSPAWTSRAGVGDASNHPMLSESLVQGSAGSIAGTFTLLNANQNTSTFILTFKASGGGAETVTQEGYRWRLDDGDQANATWAAAQDTGITAPANAIRRLRFVIDTSGDVNAATYQLEYKEANDAGWTKVA